MKTYIENRLKDIENSQDEFSKIELKAQVRELLILLDSDFISTLLSEKEIEILCIKAEKIFDIFKKTD